MTIMIISFGADEKSKLSQPAAEESAYLDEVLPFAQSMISVSLIAMWTSVGLRLCALFPAMGPLVRMMEFLVKDVLRW